MKNFIRFGTIIFIFMTVQMIAAQTTAFKYQGKLTDAGMPQATYQMQFKLFDAAAGGTQIGGTIDNASVAVTDGVFSVLLDFGTSAFTGADRFLEIGVRRNSNESYTILTPRQQIASSPYSIRTLSAQQADVSLDSQKLGGVAASEYVTNTTGNTSFIRNQTTQQTANFNISGNALVGGLVGLGTGTNGNFRLDSFGSIRTFNSTAAHFVAETTGGTNTWARFYMRSPNRSWFMGTSQNFNGDQFYLVDESAGQTRMAIATNGNVGFGTTNPNTRLTLSGGVPWTSNGWTASMNMQNGSTLGWEANASGQRFGIGQSGGGLFFFRTNSAFGNAANPANYDLVITDTGNLAQFSNGYGLPKAMLFVLANGTISRCYNGTTGVSMSGGTTTTGCGFTVTHPATHYYTINFGFNVAGRFMALSSYATPLPIFGDISPITGRIIANTNVNMIDALFWRTNDVAPQPSDFFLVVY